MKHYIEKVLKFATVWSVFLLIASVMLQIFARFFLEKAPPWTEEVSRLFFIFSVAFAAPLALKSNYYIQLDVFYNRLKTQWQKRINTTILAVVLVLFIVFTIGAFKFTVMGFAEHSPSMGIKMGIAFSSMLILGLAMCYFLSLKLIRQIENPKA